MDEERLRQLGEPGCYPNKPEVVEIIQTHISVVCVAGEHVFKLKKPVTLPFLDFSRQEDRRRYCEEEVRLNRRLCPELYLGVVDLVEDSSGLHFAMTLDAISADARVIDHAVHMRRLPADRMLDVLLKRGEVSEEEVRGLAEAMATFHLTLPAAVVSAPAVATPAKPAGTAGTAAPAKPAGIAGTAAPARLGAPAASEGEHGSPEELEALVVANFSETRPLRGGVFLEELHSALERRAFDDIEQILPVLHARRRCGKVVEGHGDLHARNICMTHPPTIYDCLEFSEAFRWADTATENAFLLMDLTYRGHRDLAATYLETYVARTADEEQYAILGPLMRYRAMVRGKVDALASQELEIPKEKRTSFIASARRHLNLVAASYLDEQSPWIVLACGLPGAGKSYLMDELARTTGWRILRSDVLRKEMRGVEPLDRLPTETYTLRSSAEVYDEAFRQASAELSRGNVLLDAGFRRPESRLQALALASEKGARLLVVSVQATEEQIAARLARRKEQQRSVSDAGFDVYLKLRGDFVAPSTSEGMDVLALDSEAPAEMQVARVLARMLKN